MRNLHPELYHVSSYLELEQARFEEKLQVSMDVEDDLNCLVPSFILQPLVENAVRYGADAKGMRTVSIQARTRDGLGEISVSDKGPGIPKDMVIQLYSGEGRGGVGLKNVHRRIELYYGIGYGLTIESQEGRGTSVCIKIPLTSAK